VTVIPAKENPLPFAETLLHSHPISDALDRCAYDRCVLLTGAAGSLKGIFTGLLFAKRKRQIIYVAPDVQSALNVWNDASLLVGENELVYIGERHTQKRSAVETLENNFAENADTLRTLLEEPVKLVVTDAETFLTAFPSQKEIRENSVHLERFASMKQEELIKRLAFGHASLAVSSSRAKKSPCAAASSTSSLSVSAIRYASSSSAMRSIQYASSIR
jgi:transcription-repair coupling factor (superfamily II helicase)